MKWFVVAAIVLLTLAVTPAFANDLTVDSTNAAWKQVNSQAYGPFTWVLPAAIDGCGSENEPTCEPTGHWILNKAAGPNSINEFIHFDEYDVTGELVVSDYILLGNGASGSFEVWFFSDPTFPDVSADGTTITWNGVQYFDLTGGPLCTENAVTGCIVGQQISDPNLSGLNITFASDGETGFDPFGAGYDTSDGISFTGVSAPNAVPEPASLVLLGTGLAGLLRKRFVA